MTTTNEPVLKASAPGEIVDLHGHAGAYVETPFGIMRVWSTSPDHLGIATGEGGIETLLVNRIEHTVMMHVPRVESLDADKKRQVLFEHKGWGVSYHEPYLRRVDGWDGVKFRDPSMAARDKVRKALVTVIGDFAESEAGKVLLAEAARRKANSAVEAARHRVEVAKAALTEAEAALAVLEG